RDPVQSIKQISQDLTLTSTFEITNGQHLTALEIQEVFLNAAEKYFPEEWVIQEWRNILHDLQKDHYLCQDRLDWIAKKVLLESFAEAENLNWQRDLTILQSLDLAYADLDPEQGLYHALCENHAMRQLASEDAVAAALHAPPANS